MRNITALISKAIGVSNESFSLLVEPINAGNGTRVGYSAAIINVASGETISLESDWEIQLAAEGATVVFAIEALDAICAGDFA